MGCVLGKPAGGDNRSPKDDEGASGKTAPEQGPETVTVTEDDGASASTVSDGEVTGGGAVRIRKDAAAQAQIQTWRTWHTGDFSAESARDVRRRNRPEYILRMTPEGWPPWLLAACGDSIKDWTPRRASTFEKIEKIGQGTYSNVYKARDLVTGKIVALKKVRFDNMEEESVKFMAREILVLRRLDHPNVIKLEGMVTSRVSCSLYLVFEYMEHDLAGLAATQNVKFSEPQVKCYMKQLLSGLEHCHKRGVLHRDIKGSNLLIDNEGNLKIADFGLATFYDPKQKHTMTSRVVTLWYRPPELLLGATHYGIGVDLWSAGCILAELLEGKPIMPGRTEVEQLHKIFKLCGSPSDDYWKKYKLQNGALFKPQHPYKRCVAEAFKDFPPSSLPLVDTLLSIDPEARDTATTALSSDFFTTEPFACDPSSLPTYPPSKELSVKLRDEEARRQKGVSGKSIAVDGTRRIRIRGDRTGRAVPAPEANAEIQSNLDRWRPMTQTNAKSKSEKFPPPHQDGAVGHPLEESNKSSIFGATDSSFSKPSNSSNTSDERKISNKDRSHGSSSSRKFLKNLKPSALGLSMDLLFKNKSDIFGSQR